MSFYISVYQKENIGYQSNMLTQRPEKMKQKHERMDNNNASKSYCAGSVHTFMDKFHHDLSYLSFIWASS